jgi:tetratricopeptide (TPR) repeat protein
MVGQSITSKSGKRSRPRRRSLGLFLIMSTLLAICSAVAIAQLQQWSRDAEIHEAQAAWGRGNRALEQRQAEQAVAEFTRAIELDAQFVPARVSRGNAEVALLDYSKAETDFNIGLIIDPNYAAGYFSRGMLHWLRGELPSADGDFRKLVALRPDDPFAVSRLAVVLYEQNKKGDVEILYRDLYGRDAKRDWALSGWLDAVSASRGVNRLLEQIQVLKARGAERDILAYWEGKALHDLRRYSDAIGPLRVATRGDPEKLPLDAFLLLAKSYYALGDSVNCYATMQTYAGRLGRSEELKSTVCQ